ncbi:MAG TPA: sigma-70 family RNA polymerase sigma factor [Firmicutes bacterium]|nr:sigma-70 family RNA polymerase sigma factor [Bacillota bacterium]
MKVTVSPQAEYQAVDPSTSHRHQQLEYLMRRFGDKVLHLAYSYLGDRFWAEDVAQEVFFRVYLSLDRFRGDSSYYTWIYRIAVNLCRDHLRLRAHEPSVEIPAPGPVSTAPDPEETVLDRSEQEELWQAVCSLPLAYREAIVLHYYHELPLKDVARVLNVSPTTMRVRLFRARRKLAEILKD